MAILKPSTPFISIPFCTTSSTLHLLAFLESTVPSFLPPSRTFFVILFHSPVGAVGRDTDAVTSTTTSCVSPSSNNNNNDPSSLNNIGDTCDITASYDSIHDPPSFNNDKRTVDNYGDSFGRTSTTYILHSNVEGTK